MTGLGKIGQNTAFKVFYLFLPVGCLGPWDAVLLIWKLAQASLPYAPQHFSIFAKLIIADFEKKMPRKGVAKARGNALPL